MFSGSFRGVFRVFSGCFQVILRLFSGDFQEVSSGYFQGVFPYALSGYALWTLPILTSYNSLSCPSRRKSSEEWGFSRPPPLPYWPMRASTRKHHFETFDLQAFADGLIQDIRCAILSLLNIFH